MFPRCQKGNVFTTVTSKARLLTDKDNVFLVVATLVMAVVRKEVVELNGVRH